MLRTTLWLLLASMPGIAQSHQIAVVGGYNYQNSDQGEGIRSNLNGWFISGQLDLNSMVSITAEVDSYYGSSQSMGLSQQNFVAGPQLTFGNDKAKFRPCIYIQAGDQRSAVNGIAEHAFNAQIGEGLQIKLDSHFSLQLTPLEYNFATPNGSSTHSFSAKAGISWIVLQTLR